MKLEVLWGVMLVSVVLAACQQVPTPLTPPNTKEVPMQVERFGVYVVAEDVSRSAAFYGKLLSAEPEVRMPELVGFDVGGGFFAVISRQAYAPNVRRGDSAVPYVRVSDVERLHAHVQHVAPESLLMPQVAVEGQFRFFKMKDPDGNTLEFFSVSSAR